MNGNLNTSLRGRATPDPMARFDGLPAELRLWLARAALPWSAASALRLWRRALCECADPQGALDRMDAAQARMLARDARRVWGTDYPA